MAVPGRRIAGAKVGEPRDIVIGAAHPGGGAARFPEVARPGLVDGAGNAVVAGRACLVVLGPHVAFDRGARPDQLAGHWIARVDPPDDAELAARYARQQQAFGDQGGGRHGIPGRVVTHFFFPHDGAGLLIEGDQLRVQGAENDQVAIQGGAPIDHVAARHDAVRQAMLVFPQLAARLQVHRKDARVRGGNKHLAIVNERLRFLAALLFTAKRHRPGRHKLAHRPGVDLGERRIALALGAHAEGQHAGRLPGRLRQHGIADVGGVGHAHSGPADQDPYHFLMHHFLLSFYGCLRCATGSVWRRRHSSSVKSRERVRNRCPVPLSSENMPPLPATTSMISWVCSQYANCSSPM